MKSICLAATKGGAGKTTLAINLACAAVAARKSAAIVDIDPQASARSWFEWRQLTLPAVVDDIAENLPNMLNTAREQGVDYVFVDTQGRSGGGGSVAIEACDLVLIPCRVGAFDVVSLKQTIDLVRSCDAIDKSALVINGAPVRGKEVDQARSALLAVDVPLLPVVVSDYASFRQSVAAGRSAVEDDPHGKPAAEIKALLKQIDKRLA